MSMQETHVSYVHAIKHVLYGHAIKCFIWAKEQTEYCAGQWTSLTDGCRDIFTIERPVSLNIS